MVVYSNTEHMPLPCVYRSGYLGVAWRRDREADGTRLLNERAPKGHRGFESLRLRQFYYSSVIFQYFTKLRNLYPRLYPRNFLLGHCKMSAQRAVMSFGFDMFRSGASDRIVVTERRFERHIDQKAFVTFWCRRHACFQSAATSVTMSA